MRLTRKAELEDGAGRRSSPRRLDQRGIRRDERSEALNCMALGLEQDAEVTAAGCQALVADLEVSHRGIDRRLRGWLRCVPLAKLPAPTRVPWVPPSLSPSRR